MPVARVSKESSQLKVLASCDVEEYPTAMGVSADGNHCAVVTGSGELVIIELSTGRVAARTTAHANGASSIAWSPTRDTIVTGGQDGVARIFSADGTLRVELPSGTNAWAEHVAWSPDGTRIAVGAGKTVRIWSCEGAPLLETEAHESTVSGLAWNRDGTAITTCCYGGVRIFPVVAALTARHFAFSGSLISLSLHPTDRVVACGAQDCSVQFWRTTTGSHAAMSGYPIKPRALSWDARGELLATNGDKTVTVWSFAGKGPEGSRPIRLEGHAAACTTVAFSPRKGVLASGAEDTGVILWEPKRTTKPVAFAFLDDFVVGLAWHPQHRALVAADAAGHVRVLAPAA